MGHALLRPGCPVRQGQDGRRAHVAHVWPRPHHHQGAPGQQGSLPGLHVEPLRVPDQKKQSGAPTANIERVLEDAGLDLADFDEWARRQSKPTSADLTPEVRAKTAAWLVSNPAKLDEIRAVHDESPDTDTDAREPGEE